MLDGERPFDPRKQEMTPSETAEQSATSHKDGSMKNVETAGSHEGLPADPTELPPDRIDLMPAAELGEEDEPTEEAGEAAA